MRLCPPTFQADLYIIEILFILTIMQKSATQKKWDHHQCIFHATVLVACQIEAKAQNYYEILNVKNDASEKEIKTRLQRKVKL